jgi:Uma2 family endonuclease
VKTATLYLTPQDHGRPLTVEELERAGGLEGYYYEVIDGRLVVWPLPDMPHDVIRQWLADKLRDYSQTHRDIINHLHAPARVYVPKRQPVTAPEPDIAVYNDLPERPNIKLLNWRDFSPFLVAEVLWKDTVTKDLERNYELYLQVPSIREYWIIDPFAQGDATMLTVHRRRGRQWQRPIEIAVGGEYTTRLLPEFVLRLNPLH